MFSSKFERGVLPVRFVGLRKILAKAKENCVLKESFPPLAYSKVIKLIICRTSWEPSIMEGCIVRLSK